MASAWGSSWGSAWGNAWGSIATETVTQGGGGGSKKKRQLKGKEKYRQIDDEINAAKKFAYQSNIGSGKIPSHDDLQSTITELVSEELQAKGIITDEVDDHLMAVRINNEAISLWLIFIVAEI